jgi:hypothetical protein
MVTRFDLPVLRYRAMIHSVLAPGLAERSYCSGKHRLAGNPEPK